MSNPKSTKIAKFTTTTADLVRVRLITHSQITLPIIKLIYLGNQEDLVRVSILKIPKNAEEHQGFSIKV